MRAAIPLILGLIIGAIGSILFQRSFPPDPGTSAAKIAELDEQLTRTKIRLAALEAANPRKPTSTAAKLRAGASTIFEDLRDGREVDLDDVFQASKPVLRDLSPIFDRIRRRELKHKNDQVLADLTRKYHLDPSQQKALKAWQQSKAEFETKIVSAVLTSDSTKLGDFAKATRAPRTNNGLDSFMESTLTGEDLARYKTDRLNERVQNVQNEAEHKVSRLHHAVALDEAQQDKVFAIMARSSPEFDPSMKFEGLGDDTAKLTPGQSRNDAIMEVLRPEQRQQYEERRAHRRHEAEQEFREMGLKFPADWDMFEDE
jgi:hypothetical protein